jgi:putative sigma-54 modulation protein
MDQKEKSNIRIGRRALDSVLSVDTFEQEFLVEISIETSGLCLSRTEMENFRGHIRQRVEETFSRIKRRITHVSVHLADVNGPRGGYDKHCMVKVSLGGATAALAQGSDRNLFALVNRVSVCAAQVTLKRLKRRLGNATVRTMSDTSADTHRDA